MFDIGKINYMDGVYSGSSINGMEVMIIDSEVRARKIINGFKRNYHYGMNPDAVLDNVLEQYNINEYDLSEKEVKYIEKKLNEIVRRA
jgi:hypothetical protein